MGWSPQLFSALPLTKSLAPEIRVVIADEDPRSRESSRRTLESQSAVKLLGMCCNVTELIHAVKLYTPDLVLVDFNLLPKHERRALGALPVRGKPLLIFTGTNESSAVRAFELRALDYLVKPFDQKRMHAALERTRAEMLNAQDRDFTLRLLDFLAEARTESPMDRRLVVKAAGRVVFLDVDEIEWIEAAANYVRLQTADHSYLMREAISRIASRLDPLQFVRIHRSTIVNVRKIKELQPSSHGDYMVILANGKELSCSRGYRARLRELIASAPRFSAVG